MNGDNLPKLLVLGLVLLVAFVIGAVVWTVVSPEKKENDYTPEDLKAQSLKELGRNHVTDISGVSYNSNPPTSGNHFPMWVQRGVFDMLISDGYLIHSLEHGYIVMSYNCGPKGDAVYKVLESGAPLTKMQGDLKATAAMRPLKTDNLPKKEVDLPQEFGSESCKTLVKGLSQFLDNYQRIVIVPRPNMDSVIALTAWGKIDKMNAFDQKRIGAFVDAFHNKGPEQTVE